MSVFQAMLRLLADSPNPDAALNMLERFVSLDHYDLVRSLERHPQLLHYALALFGNSQYLGETLIQNPDLLQGFVREGALGRMQSAEEFAGSFARFSSRSFETDTSRLLARFKRREYVRIVLRDILGIATLAETTAEISALTDVLIEEALRISESSLHRRYGIAEHYDAEGRLVPTRFAVLSLGKLGGSELNYSSDIDLLFIFEGGRDAEAMPIAGREFFVRLAQELTDILGRVTSEGPLFRIDLRLRPRGTEGELAVQFERCLYYYGEVAHDWELQALIKVRHSAGDQALARQFIRRVQPFVYRGEINFPAIETALNSLDKMKKRSRRGLAGRIADTAVDVKIDRGGIRDIEFLVQCLQRVYGGAEPWLRSGGTLFSMQKLHDKGHLSGADFHVLSTSYTFLRQVEHRLQIWLGQQTHTLPADPQRLRSIYRSLSPGTLDRDPLALVRVVREHMDSVAAIYERIIHQQQSVQERVSAAPPEVHVQVVRHWAEQTDSQILNRLAVDCPELYAAASALPLGSMTRRNLFRVLSATAGEDDRYQSLLKNAELLRRAIPSLASSSLITDILVRHPEDLCELANAGLSPAAHETATGTAEGTAARADDPAALGDGRSQSEVMADLRTTFRRRMVRSCMRDCLRPRPVWDSLAELTAAAEAAIRNAFQAVDAPEDCAVFALGRLGTAEFDVLSDADLMLVHGDSVPSDRAAAAAAGLLRLLGSYTGEGIVFTVDMRLRPHGTQGELATSASELARYLQNEGQPWEALSYTKLRLIAGSAELAAVVDQSVRRFHRRFAADLFGGDASFRRQLWEMRQRLEESVGRERNFKKGWGGFYDIDFIASGLAVEHGVSSAASSIMARLRALRDAGLLSEDDCGCLCYYAEFLRALEHSLRLVHGSARGSLPSSEPDLQAITRLMESSLGRGLPGKLPDALAEALTTIRTAFQHIFRV